MSNPSGTSPKACLVLDSVTERRKVKIKLLKCKGFQQVAAWAEGCCLREGKGSAGTIHPAHSVSNCESQPLLGAPCQRNTDESYPRSLDSVSLGVCGMASQPLMLQHFSELYLDYKPACKPRLLLTAGVGAPPPCLPPPSLLPLESF